MSLGPALANHVAGQIGCLLFVALLAGAGLALGGWWLFSHFTISFGWTP